MMRDFAILGFALAAVACAVAFGACAGGEDDDDDDDDTGGNNDVSGDLTWQEPPSDLFVPWDEAVAYCEQLELDGHDDWRLPTINDLRSLIRGCEATELGGACGVSEGCNFECLNSACNGCNLDEGPGSNGAYWPDGYSGTTAGWWSSSRVIDSDFHAWEVESRTAAIYGTDIGTRRGVRCVR